MDNEELQNAPRFSAPPDEIISSANEPSLIPVRSPRKLMSVIGGVAAVLLVIGVASASYFVANRLRTERALAPTAPESEPLASDPDACTNSAQPCRYMWEGDYCAVDKICTQAVNFGPCECSLEGTPGDGGDCDIDPIVNCTSPYCVLGVCVESCKEGNNQVECIRETDGCVDCGANQSCPTGQTKISTAWNWHDISCGQGCPTGQGKRQRCNWGLPDPPGFSCVISGETEQCRDASGVSHWEWGACEADASCISCDPTKRDPKESNTLTFGQYGTIKAFSRNDMNTPLVITFKKNGVVYATLNAAANNPAYEIPQTFIVNTGDVLTMSVRVTGEANDSYGWRTRKAENTCGPSNNICGEDKNITLVRSMAAPKIYMANIKAGTTDAAEQCWGDALVNDDTQDYDYNDFSIHLGYAYPQDNTTPNCSNISGPSTLTLGETGTYTAKYYKSGSGGLTNGSIFYSTTVNGVDQKNINNLFSNPYNPPVTQNGQSLTTTFKPTQVGKYWLRCRAWNDGIAECRPPATVDGPPRFACAGGNGGTYEMLVTVVTAAAPVCRETCSANTPCASGLVCGTDNKCHNSTCPTTDDASCQCPAPMCIASRVFELKNSTWTIVTNLSTLKAGAAVRFGVNGTAITKARFKINDGNWIESTSKMTASDGKSYVYINHALTSGDYEVRSEIQ